MPPETGLNSVSRPRRDAGSGQPQTYLVTVPDEPNIFTSFDSLPNLHRGAERLRRILVQRNFADSSIPSIFCDYSHYTRVPRPPLSFSHFLSWGDSPSDTSLSVASCALHTQCNTVSMVCLDLDCMSCFVAVPSVFVATRAMWEFRRARTMAPFYFALCKLGAQPSDSTEVIDALCKRHSAPIVKLSDASLSVASCAKLTVASWRKSSTTSLLHDHTRVQIAA